MLYGTSTLDEREIHPTLGVVEEELYVNKDSDVAHVMAETESSVCDDIELSHANYRFRSDTSAIVGGRICQHCFDITEGYFEEILTESAFSRLQKQIDNGVY